MCIWMRYQGESQGQMPTAGFLQLLVHLGHVPQAHFSLIDILIHFLQRPCHLCAFCLHSLDFFAVWDASERSNLRKSQSVYSLWQWCSKTRYTDTCLLKLLFTIQFAPLVLHVQDISKTNTTRWKARYLLAAQINMGNLVTLTTRLPQWRTEFIPWCHDFQLSLFTLLNLSGSCNPDIPPNFWASLSESRQTHLQAMFSRRCSIGIMLSIALTSSLSERRAEALPFWKLGSVTGLLAFWGSKSS